MKKIIKYLSILLMGFAGGALSHWFLGWLKPIDVATSDAVAIANTYIVFTTIIFVGVTVILAVAGFVFTQQFSASKEAQTSVIFAELCERCKTDENFGIKIVTNVLENTDVLRHIEQVFKTKIDALLKARSEQKVAEATKATNEAEAAKNLADELYKE